MLVVFFLIIRRPPISTRTNSPFSYTYLFRSCSKRRSEVTSFYIDAMHADERALGVQTPDFEPRATDHVGDMLGIIQRLETNGLAYKSEDGDVNYAVRDFPGYGKLSGKRSEEHTSELQSLMRISYAVFCLKKKNKNNNWNMTNKST